jgi:predicted nucleic acid-binding protein
VQKWNIDVADSIVSDDDDLLVLDTYRIRVLTVRQCADELGIETYKA